MSNYTETSVYQKVPEHPLNKSPVSSANMRSTVQTLVNRDKYNLDYIAEYAGYVDRLIENDTRFNIETIHCVSLSAAAWNAAYNTSATEPVWSMIKSNENNVLTCNLAFTSDNGTLFVDLDTNPAIDAYMSSVVINLKGPVSQPTNLPVNMPRASVRVTNVDGTGTILGSVEQLDTSANSSEFKTQHNITLLYASGNRTKIVGGTRYSLRVSPGWGTYNTAGLTISDIQVKYSNGA